MRQALLYSFDHVLCILREISVCFAFERFVSSFIDKGPNETLFGMSGNSLSVFL